MLLGGDLNSYSEHYLFRHYTKKDVASLVAIVKSDKSTKTEKRIAQKQIDQAVAKMNEIFGVDIAKSCHHGSADFTNEFLRAINPIATVISSGDNESHSHPRPDTLGTIGRYSRGARALIFNTELARSSKEFIDLKKVGSWKQRERTVTVYGMINVRTDGDKVVIAQKLEKPGSSKNWDIHRLEWNDSSSEFEYVSKYI